MAQIRYDGKQHQLGCFNCEEEAARAYDRAAEDSQGGGGTVELPCQKKRLALKDTFRGRYMYENSVGRVARAGLLFIVAVPY
jgi:hypothetical protein